MKAFVFGKFKRQNVQVKKFVLFTEANNIFLLERNCFFALPRVPDIRSSLNRGGRGGVISSETNLVHQIPIRHIPQGPHEMLRHQFLRSVTN